MKLKTHAHEHASRGTLLCGVVAALMIVMISSAASAQDAAKMKGEIQQYTLKLADLEKADTDKGAIQELKLTQLWLNEAQAQLVREEEEIAQKNLRRVGIAVEMIARLIEQAKAERQANDRESAALSMKQEAQDAKIALEAAEAEKRKLLSETAKPDGGE